MDRKQNRLSFFVICFLSLIILAGCLGNNTATSSPSVHVQGDAGQLSNYTKISAEVNLTPLNNDDAILESIEINVGIDIPACGFAGGIELTTYSDWSLVWEKTGRDKVVFVLPFPLDSKTITVKPDSRVIVTRGNSYIQFDYGTLVGTTKSLVDGTEYCDFFPDLPDVPDYQEQIEKWQTIPDLNLDTFSMGSFQIDIPPGNDTPTVIPISTVITPIFEGCQPPEIPRLSFNPDLSATVGTQVEIHAEAAWNSCFRAMRLLIDNNIVYELGQPAFTYIWDTSGFSPGDHNIRLEVGAQADTSWLSPSVMELNYTLKDETSSTTLPPSGSDGLQGIWNGPVNQPGSRYYTTILTLSGCSEENTVCGSVEYPELSCGGDITFLYEENGTYYLRENITYGSCIPEVYIELRQFSGNSWVSEYHWNYSAQRGSAQAILTRTK